MVNKEIYNELIKFINPSNIKMQESMKKHTSFKIGGNADFFVRTETIDEIKNILEFVNKNNINYFVIGNGSNILVTDKGIRGIVIKIDLSGIEIQNKIEDEAMELEKNLVAEEKENYNLNQVRVTVGAGVKLGALARNFIKREYRRF